MTQNKQFHETLITIENIPNDDAERRLIEIVKQIPGRQQFDLQNRKVLKIWGDEPLALNPLKEALANQGFVIGSISTKNQSASSALESSDNSLSSTDLNLRITGMTCHSCELLIERSWKNLPGVENVKVNAGTGKATLKTDGSKITLHELQSAVGNHQYKIRWDNQSNESNDDSELIKPRISAIQLLGMFVFALVVLNIFSRLGIFKAGASIGTGVTFASALLIGLIASTSSCLAINGGLLLSSAATFNQKYSSATRLGKMRPVFLFVAGRLASYGILGGLLGLIGKSFTFSPVFTAAIMILAAIYMISMGLEMLGIAPQWLKRLLPGSSKRLSHKILDAEKKTNPLMPLILDGATFVLPSGVTQALQLYALTTGSAVQSGLIVLIFAAGTVPMLLALGFAGTFIKGKAGVVFYQFMGALVVLLGLWNIQNGLTIAGYPLSLPKFEPATVTQTDGAKTSKTEPVPVDKDGVQVIQMAVNAGYTPDHFTIKAGVPVRWEVDGTDALGCDQFLMSRQLGIQKLLETGINIFNFTPKEAGTIQFSCSMGMYRGSFTVVE